MTANGHGITVGDLVAQQRLRIKALAGRGGLEGSVSWAHVVDHPHPWDWLDAGDLVITSGWIIPDAPGDQVRFIERLAKAGLSGLLTGEDPNAPPLKPPVLSDAMLAAAERHDFPVLLAHWQTSWIEICRLVARANETREAQALSSIVRVQDEVRAGLLKPRSSAEAVDAFSAILGCRLHLVDYETWEPLLPGTEVPDDPWRSALSAALHERGGTAPLSIGLEVGDRSCVAVPIPIERAAFLLVEVTGSRAPRLALLQHVSAACALEIARVDAIFEEEWKTGWAILSEALQGQLDPASFGANLDARGLVPPFSCIAVDAPRQSVERIERFWAVRRVPYVLTRASTVVILIHTDEERIAELRGLSARERFRAGVSDPFSTTSALADASRQARWALASLPPGAAAVGMYAVDGEGFLPRTLLESRDALDRILGPLLAYDREQDGELVRTLQTYLACDRSPKRAAEHLFVHTQTVNYRLARIHELTGRSVRSTADISEFWFALRAHALTDTGQEVTQRTWSANVSEPR